MRTIAGADKIVVLKDGLIVEQGKPSDLIKEPGLYREMTEKQNLSQDWKI